MAEMARDQPEAGEGQAGPAGLELAIGLAFLVVEEAAGEAEGSFVEGEAGLDILDIEDDIAKPDFRGVFSQSSLRS